MKLIFKAGDWVECVRPMDTNLKLGRIYQILSSQIGPRDGVSLVDFPTNIYDASRFKPSSYLAAQKQWIKDHNVKVGTKVRVVRRAGDYEFGWGTMWHSYMSECVNKEGVVTDFSSAAGLFIEGGTFPRAWWFPFFCLELVQEPTLTPAKPVEVKKAEVVKQDYIGTLYEFTPKNKAESQAVIAAASLNKKIKQNGSVNIEELWPLYLVKSGVAFDSCSHFGKVGKGSDRDLRYKKIKVSLATMIRRLAEFGVEAPKPPDPAPYPAFFMCGDCVEFKVKSGAGGRECEIIGVYPRSLTGRMSITTDELVALTDYIKSYNLKYAAKEAK